MTAILLLMLLTGLGRGAACCAPQDRATLAPTAAPAETEREQAIQRLIRQVAESGHVLQIAENPSERVSPPPQIAPGAPPLLSFRYLEGQDRHRFGRLGLVMDDAGH